MLRLWQSNVLVLLLGLTAAVAVDDFAAVEQRIRELQPTASEKRFDDIGWAKDSRHAKALATQHYRPVFMFTHDGRMNLGRC